jgi:hypothetical protein
MHALYRPVFAVCYGVVAGNLLFAQMHQSILWLQKPVFFLATHMNFHGWLLFFQMKQYPSSIVPPSFLNKPYPQQSMHCTLRHHQVWCQICNLTCLLHDTLKNQASPTSMLLYPHIFSPTPNSVH